MEACLQGRIGIVKSVLGALAARQKSGGNGGS